MPLFGRPGRPAHGVPTGGADRTLEIERLGREALLLEARQGRPLTRNDLFQTVHVPFDLIEPVTRAMTRDVPVDLRALGSLERESLERDSHEVIVRGLTERPEPMEKRGLTLADVALLSPPKRTLADHQRLFGYMRAVLQADLPPRMLMPSTVTSLLPRVSGLPPGERTPFLLVRRLGVGLYTARLVNAALGEARAT